MFNAKTIFFLAGFNFPVPNQKSRQGDLDRPDGKPTEPAQIQRPLVRAPFTPPACGLDSTGDFALIPNDPAAGVFGQEFFFGLF